MRGYVDRMARSRTPSSTTPQAPPRRGPRSGPLHDRLHPVHRHPRRRCATGCTGAYRSHSSAPSPETAAESSAKHEGWVGHQQARPRRGHQARAGHRPTRHRRRQRGTEPADVQLPHQLRHALEPDARRTAHRPHRPARASTRCRPSATTSSPAPSRRTSTARWPTASTCSAARRRPSAHPRGHRTRVPGRLSGTAQRALGRAAKTIGALLGQIDQAEQEGIEFRSEDPLPISQYAPSPVTLEDLRRVLVDRFAAYLDEPGQPVTFDLSRVSRDPDSWTALGTYGHPRLEPALARRAGLHIPDTSSLVLATSSDGPVVAVRADRSPPERVMSLADIDELGRLHRAARPICCPTPAEVSRGDSTGLRE